ncbi:uncharacterized protein LOC117176573 [Belonocnema kinseyi]|uniref:uncharacterized protein LOC117176573 n=1 Tax=Belonocnema kinseyi TaxID=2817044 RepID=UPI00143DF211|nr:uncharacterized protein LOC117176573 [Belonocnema kinseyi]
MGKHKRSARKYSSDSSDDEDYSRELFKVIKKLKTKHRNKRRRRRSSTLSSSSRDSSVSDRGSRRKRRRSRSTSRNGAYSPEISEPEVDHPPTLEREQGSPLLNWAPPANFSSVLEMQHVTSEAADSQNNRMKKGVINSLGKRCLEDRSLAPAVLEDIAIRWKDIIKIGLSSDEREQHSP